MNENKMLYLTNSSYYRSNLYKAQNLSLGSQSKTIKNNKNNKRIRYDLKKKIYHKIILSKNQIL